MSETFLLVDHENVREVVLSRLPTGWQVKIFVGRSQNSIPFTLASEAQRLGERLERIKIEGDGRNNLDFHLAYHFGALVKEHPGAGFVILSRDKGFDALLQHAAHRGVQCRRINEFAEIAASPSEAADRHFTRAFEVLSHIEKKARPRRHKTLVQQVASVFQKKLPEAEVQRIVDLLISKRLVSEANNALTYHF